ncbi:MAG: hypothetical protein CMQ22_05380 [Gammaproteobacteria bacterium]|nr:hypothetical protein [Gammaproteobacteria bacterium]
MLERRAGHEDQISISVRLGGVRCGVALLAVFVVEYAGAKLLGISGSGLFIPLCQRIVMSARPGQPNVVYLPTDDSVHLDGVRLRQFWQMPWVVCFCVTGERPQWLFRDEVTREVFAWCCREANVALSMRSVRLT